MTKLEYLNERIYFFKQVIEEDKEIMSQEYINEIKEKLALSEQIKAELEAWKIVKENTIITDNRCDVDRIEMYKGGKGYEIFKKALEVENE